MTRWLRIGECCRCGECCDGDHPDLRERGRRYDGDQVPGKCPLFRVDGELGACAGHGFDPYYMSGCNVWPSKPEQIAGYPSCTYRFVEAT